MRFVFVGADKYGHSLLYDALIRDNVRAINDPYRINKEWFKKLQFRMYNYFPISREKLRMFYSDIGRLYSDKKVIFIYFNPFIEMMSKTGYIRRLKERLPNSYHIALFWDVANAKRVDYKGIENDYDKIYIYDEVEAKKMGISYCPPVYSKRYLIPDNDMETYDVSFIGQLKGRGNVIFEVYDYLTSIGLKCHFYLRGVEKKDRIRRKGVIYGDCNIMDEEAFSYTATSKCLLDIRLPDTYALTARVREAIVYDKKILTNNPTIRTLTYYDKDMIRVFDKVEDIDQFFFSDRKKSYRYKGEWSPLRMLEQFEKDYVSDSKNKRKN